MSVLNAFSKIFEKVIKNQLIPHLDKSLSIFIAAYRERYSTQHVLIRIIEEWRLRLDNDYVVGAILMDLSKAAILEVLGQKHAQMISLMITRMTAKMDLIDESYIFFTIKLSSHSL